MSKSRLREPAARPLAQRVLAGVLDSILRLLHPIMPFVTESIWQALAEAAFERGLPQPEPAAESVMIAPWPTFPAAWQDASMEGRIGRMQELVRAIRNIRNQFLVHEKATVEVSVRAASRVAQDFDLLAPFILPLAKVSKLACGPDVTRPAQTATSVHAEFEVYVHLRGLIDVEAELQRLKKQKAEKEKQLLAVRAKLSNHSFLQRAPAEVIQQQRDQEAELVSQLKAITDTCAQLRQG
jgi:valyl-tRNA synthetase